MSYSIMDMGRSTKKQSQGSLKTLADMEQKREITNDQIASQKKTTQMGGAASGAAMAASVSGALSAGAAATTVAAGGTAAAAAGASAGAALGPWGIAIGAGIGLLAGSL